MPPWPPASPRTRRAERGRRPGPPAERLARDLVRLEPYRESGYALLMEALAMRGNVAEALLVFERVRVLLRDELGLTPAAALTALHERLLVHGCDGSDRDAAAPRTPAPGGEARPLPPLLARSESRPFVAREAALR